MNKTLGKGLALVLGMGIMAGCEYQENTAKPAQANPLIDITSGECKDVCGGKICYEVLKKSNNSNSPSRYAIESEGFEDYFVIGRRMIFADKCILFKIDASNDVLILEKLR